MKILVLSKYESAIIMSIEGLITQLEQLVIYYG